MLKPVDRSTSPKSLRLRQKEDRVLYLPGTGMLNSQRSPGDESDYHTGPEINEVQDGPNPPMESYAYQAGRI